MADKIEVTGLKELQQRFMSLAATIGGKKAQKPVAAAPERIVTGIFPNADQTRYCNRIEYRGRIEYDHAGDGIHYEVLVEAPRQPEIRRNENLASKTNELLKYGNAES